MPKIIDKVACIVHYIDGRSDEGFTRLPLSYRGQADTEYFSLSREDGTEVLVNLKHTIRVEQSIIHKE